MNNLLHTILNKIRPGNAAEEPGHTLNQSEYNYEKLLDNKHTGLFRIRTGGKGKFIHASPESIRILGFTNEEELLKANFWSVIFYPDERKALKKVIQKDGCIRNKEVRIFKKNCNSALVRISMITVENEEDGEMICDGMMEDMSGVENERETTSRLITELKSAVSVPGQPVSDFIMPVRIIDFGSTIAEAIRELGMHGTDALLLAGNKGDIKGIITGTDIQKKILGFGLDQDNPANMIMSSPVKYVSENASVSEALSICEESRLNHLVVRGENGQVKGMIRSSDIRKKALESITFYIGKVKIARTDEELKRLHRDIGNLIYPLIGNEISSRYITNIITSFSDALTRRIIELRTEEIGEPPVRFSFICLGSEGRKEESLFTDQDNAIIYDDIPKNGDVAVREYFLKLGRKVCDSLDFTGYSFCRGNKMANNPQWCQPLNVWKNYFRGWIATPEPVNLLEASAFFDLRTVYGDEAFAEILRKIIFEAVSLNSLFGYHMAYNLFMTKTPHAGGILSERTIDLKSAIAPFIMFARTYSLTNGIAATNTIERLAALSEKTILNERSAEEILYAYNYLMKLRFRTQSEQIRRGLPLSNLLDTGRLIEFESALLKKVLAFIPDIQNRIKMDFRIS
jgi:CBS domain-containing protein